MHKSGCYRYTLDHTPSIAMEMSSTRNQRWFYCIIIAVLFCINTTSYGLVVQIQEHGPNEGEVCPGDIFTLNCTVTGSQTVIHAVLQSTNALQALQPASAYAYYEYNPPFDQPDLYPLRVNNLERSWRCYTMYLHSATSTGDSHQINASISVDYTHMYHSSIRLIGCGGEAAVGGGRRLHSVILHFSIKGKRHNYRDPLQWAWSIE